MAVNRQQMLDNFVARVNGRGRCVVEPNGEITRTLCVYFDQVSDHPGCAIGCQPGFKEKFYEEFYKLTPKLFEQGIVDLGADLDEVAKFFDVDEDDDDDWCFLEDLQELHDHPQNWQGDNLKFERIQAFARIWELKNPLDV